MPTASDNVRWSGVALLDDSLNLAYRGARAAKPGFNITLQRDFDTGVGAVEIVSAGNYPRIPQSDLKWLLCRDQAQGGK